MTEHQKKWVLILTSIPFLLAARMYWQYYPGILPCLVFWCIALSDEPLRWSEMRQRRRVLYGLSVVGALGNAVATITNGGYMPVLHSYLSQERLILAAAGESVWVPLTETSRMQWLCDIYVGGSSIGDWAIGLRTRRITVELDI